MKQVISIADFATILNLINDKIAQLELPPMRYPSDKTPYKQLREEHIEFIKVDPYYQSLLHAKKALEECMVEIEVPDLEVEKWVKLKII